MSADQKILDRVTSELSNSELSNDFKTPLNYYLGNPNGKEVEGRSQVTSTDVADAIEWMLPQIMKSFTQNNEIVIFDPVHQGDELQAELESEFVYEVLMKENEGFILLHQFVKDALLQQNGILKVFYNTSSKTESIAITGASAEEFQLASSQPDVTISQYEEYFDTDANTPLVNFLCTVERPTSKVQIVSVPPESFRVNSDHDSISLEDARFTAHLLTKTASELREDGISEKIISEILSNDNSHTESDYRFFAQGENPSSFDSDDSEALINVAECYLKMDINNDGISEFCKVTVAGAESPTHVLSVEEMDYSPWVSTTPILMSHKFWGVSIFDRLKEIQDQKTALWRNMFDNLYLQNNQRNIVLEGQVNIDDLLLSRPGGIIRAKHPNAVTPLVTPQIGPESALMMQYLDSVRAGRVGVAPEGEAAPQNIGERIGSQGLERLMTAKEELVGLIVRVISETGIKPLCVKIRDLLVAHADAVTDFQFRGQWVKVKPSAWQQRFKSTVRVGTGTGNHERKIGAIREVLAVYEKLMADPSQALVTPLQIYTALDDLCKLSGLNGATRYFVDPRSQEGQQLAQQKQQAQQQNQQLQAVMAQAQADLAKAEQIKAQAASQTAIAKTQAEAVKAQLGSQKQEYEASLAVLRQELEEAKAAAAAAKNAAELEFKYAQLNRTSALEMARIEAIHKDEQNSNYQGNLSSIEEPR